MNHDCSKCEANLECRITLACREEHDNLMTITEEQLHQLIETLTVGCTACPCLDECADESKSCFELLKEWLCL